MNTDNFLKPETNIIGTELTVLDFWRWAFSNFQINSLRGIFAEFLVGAAIGSLNLSRIEWDAYDLKFNNKKIEVKSAAYIQSWYSGRPSKISFNIGAKREYDYTLNKYSPTVKRNADIYVFCLLKEKNPQLMNPLDTSQWVFYVVQTEVLDNRYLHQKTITLSSLDKISDPIVYKDLKQAITHLARK